MTQAEDNPRSRIRICEVGPRDGLQNETAMVSTEEKLTLIARAVDAGIRRLEVASFVHPKRVPQMADAEAVVDGVEPRSDVCYIGLVLNMKGYERARETRVNEIGTVVCATDTFAQKNQGQATWRESMRVAADIIRLATREGRSAQATIGLSCGCPFEGEVDPGRVVEIAKTVADAGAVDIAIADTIGVGVPNQVRDLFDRVHNAVGDVPLRAHFHNTRNTGIANAWAAVESGVTTIDASIGGLGGCPFAPRATGNVATEDLVYMLDRAGVRTDTDLAKLIELAHWAGSLLGQPAASMVSKAGGFPS